MILITEFLKRDTIKSRILRTAGAFAIMVMSASTPHSFTFADSADSFRVASLPDQAHNSEMAGSVAVHNFNRDDFISAKDVIIGVFDLFGDDEIDYIEDETGQVKPVIRPEKKPDNAREADNDNNGKGDIYAGHDVDKVILHEQLELPFEDPSVNINSSIQAKAKHYKHAVNTHSDAIVGGFLSRKDAALYKRIFSLQAAGDIRAADAEIAKLEDQRLRGHYLYQRYMHPTAYITRFDELKSWMDAYSDLPGAKAIYKLALKKMPSAYSEGLKKPVSASQIVKRPEPHIYRGVDYVSDTPRSSREIRAVNALEKSIRANVKRNRFSIALAKLKKAQAQLDHVEYDILRSYIAEGYLYSGYLDKAYALAHESFERSGIYAPMSGWVAGLVSWNKGNFAGAATYFKAVAQSQFSDSWEQSAGAFWAARSYMQLSQSHNARIWLTEALNHPRTFYGLIATRALGKPLNFNWDLPKFNKAHAETLFSTANGRRAADLISAGQIHMAEDELLRLNPRKNKAMQEAILAYAAHKGLPALALRAGTAYEAPQGSHYDAALYPVGHWQSYADYKIDPDLVHAIMRQESRFNARAESHSGARGLMQIMPTTASFISGKRHMKSASGQEQLLDPSTNLALGQKYIDYLLRNKYVNDDLISMLIAYNAGPGNLRRWKKKWSRVQDPLLFMELISARETRGYVEKVLANFWMYRARSGVASPTLDAVAKGRQALYSDAQRAHGSGLFTVAQNTR